MKNFKDGFNDFKKGGNETGGRPKFGFAGGAGHKGGGNGSFGKPRFENRGGERSFNRGGERPSGEMFTATCSSCHKSCEVPFRPNGEKPVYCSACFGKMRDDADRGGDRNDARREKPAYVKSERPAFNQNAPQREERSKDLEAIRIHLAKIELQLNRVLEFVNPPVPVVKAAKVVATVEATAPASTSEAAPKKERKPKTEAAPKVTKKVAVKKAAKTVVKKAVKKVTKK